jgi:hypothetical protein
MLSRAKFLRNRLDGRGVDHFTGSLAKIERRYRAVKSIYSFAETIERLKKESLRKA